MPLEGVKQELADIEIKQQELERQGKIIVEHSSGMQQDAGSNTSRNIGLSTFWAFNFRCVPHISSFNSEWQRLPVAIRQVVKRV